MPRIAPGLHTFNGGEWSKRLWGRVDLAKYVNACRRCENFIPLVQGPLTKRPGFRHVAPLRENLPAVRLLPFVFSEDQAYVIEATAGAFRFYRRQAPVVEAGQGVTEVSQTDPAVATAPAHGYETGDEVVLGGLAGSDPLQGRRSRVTVLDEDRFILDQVQAATFAPYAGGGIAQRVYQVAHDYAAEDLPRLRWVQSLDVLYLFCPGRRPKTLSRYGETDWRFEEPSFDDGPYLNENTTDTAVSTVDPASHAAGDLITVTFNGTAGLNGGDGFSSADLGRLLRWMNKTSGTPEYYRWAVGRIEAVNDTRTVQLRVLVPQRGGTLVRSGRAWRLGAWSDQRGWPVCGAFYKGRLWVGNSLSHPETLWGSSIGDYESFAPTVLERSDTEGALPLAGDADALWLTAAGEEVSLIRWIAPIGTLAVGTSGGEKTIQGSNLAEAITPSNAAILPASSVGVADLPPARIDAAVLYVSRDRKRLHELAYKLDADSYLSPEMTLLAGHIGEESPLAEICFQRRPWRILWARRDDGLLVGFTYNREEEVTAWHRHRLAGQEARVVGLCCIPGEGDDELWVAVERRIGGELRRSVELLERDRSFAADEGSEEAFFVDAGLSYSGPPTQVLRGLEHLEGETVAVLADGAVHRPLRVEGGEIRLDRPTRRLHAGLPFASWLETMNLEPGLGDGAALGRPKTLTAVDLLVVASLGGRVGPDAAALEPLLARRDGQAMDAPPPLFTGLRRVEWRGGWRTEKRLVVMHDQPLPFTLAGAVPQLSINEG